MSDIDKTHIEKISKDFASGIGEIKGSGWLIVDPLSGFLNACGYKNELSQIPPKDGKPLVLIMTFEDGTRFIPAGSDLGFEGVEDWSWI